MSLGYKVIEPSGKATVVIAEDMRQVRERVSDM